MDDIDSGGQRVFVKPTRIGYSPSLSLRTNNLPLREMGEDEFDVTVIINFFFLEYFR
jgi:hypothetical protein